MLGEEYFPQGQRDFSWLNVFQVNRLTLCFFDMHDANRTTTMRFLMKWKLSRQ